MLIGAILWWVEIVYGGYLDSFIASGSVWAPITVIAAIIILVRVHPEPADACCKCFEDGVAFAGVFAGVKLGQWRRPPVQSGGYMLSHPMAPLVLSIIRATARVVLGSYPHKS